MVRECFRFNAAKRGLAKLCNNSKLGKLKDRNNRTITKIITEPKVLRVFLATPGIEVAKFFFTRDEVIWLSSKRRADEDIPSLRHTNDAIVAYATAGAWIHL